MRIALSAVLGCLAGAIFALAVVLPSDAARQFVLHRDNWSSGSIWSHPFWLFRRSRQEADREALAEKCYRDDSRVKRALYFPWLQDGVTVKDRDHLRPRGPAGYQLPVIAEDLWSGFNDVWKDRFSLLGSDRLRFGLALEGQRLNEALAKGRVNLERGVVTYDLQEQAIAYSGQIGEVCAALALRPPLPPIQN